MDDPHRGPRQRHDAPADPGGRRAHQRGHDRLRQGPGARRHRARAHLAGHRRGRHAHQHRHDPRRRRRGLHRADHRPERQRPELPRPDGVQAERHAGGPPRADDTTLHPERRHDDRRQRRATHRRQPVRILRPGPHARGGHAQRQRQRRGAQDHQQRWRRRADPGRDAADDLLQQHLRDRRRRRRLPPAERRHAAYAPGDLGDRARRRRQRQARRDLGRRAGHRLHAAGRPVLSGRPDHDPGLAAHRDVHDRHRRLHADLRARRRRRDRAGWDLIALGRRRGGQGESDLHLHRHALGTRHRRGERPLVGPGHRLGGRRRRLPAGPRQLPDGRRPQLRRWRDDQDRDVDLDAGRRHTRARRDLRASTSATRRPSGSRGRRRPRRSSTTTPR